MNYTPLPYYLTIKESNIQGLGLFATDDLDENLPIGISHVKDIRFDDGYIRTPLGGFVNHSDKPNCYWVEEDDLIHMKTKTPIKCGEELTLKYKWYDPSE